MKYLSLLLLLGCGGEAPKEQPKKEVKEVKKEAKAEPKKEEKKEVKAEPKKEEKKEEKAAASAGRTGEEVYAQVCVTCHMADGKGVEAVYPPLAGSDWLAKKDDVLIRIVLHGLGGEIEVNGQKYNSQMAAWGGQLNDMEVANVLTYVRSSWGGSLPAVKPEEVAKVRAEYKDHAPWKPEELLK